MSQSASRSRFLLGAETLEGFGEDLRIDGEDDVVRITKGVLEDAVDETFEVFGGEEAFVRRDADVVVPEELGNDCDWRWRFINTGGRLMKYMVNVFRWARVWS